VGLERIHVGRLEVKASFTSIGKCPTFCAHDCGNLLYQSIIESCSSQNGIGKLVAWLQFLLDVKTTPGLFATP